MLAALALPLLFATRPAAALPQDSTRRDTAFAEIALQVDVEREASTLVIALTRDSVVYLPVRVLLELAAIRVDTVAPGVRLLARITETLLGLDTDGDRGFRGREVFPIGAHAFWRGEELFADPELLSRWLAVDVTMYWVELQVTLTRADALPVVVRALRERRRAAAIARFTATGTLPYLAARRPLADGLVLDWRFSFGSQDAAHNNALDLGAGVQVLGGSLEAQTTRVRSPLGVTQTSHWSWEAAWPGATVVRQARLGSIAITGPRGFGVRGAAVSNSPYLRPAEFGDFGFRGRVPPGWEVELYRGEELLGFAPADAQGRFAIDVPVIYGPNPLEVVAYGPRGEQWRRSRTYAVPFDRLPARQFEYGVGGGACQTGLLCEAAGNLDLRYGLTNAVSLEAGYDRVWRDSLPDLDHPYALVAMQPLPPLGVQVEAVAHGFTRVQTDVDPSPDFHLDVAHFRYATDVVQPVLGTAFRRYQTVGGMFWRPGIGEYTYLQASAGHVEEVGLTRVFWRGSLTARTLGARVLLGVRRERASAPASPASIQSGLELGADGVLDVGPKPLAGTFMRVTLATDCSGTRLWCVGAVQRAGLLLSRSIGSSLRLEFGLRHERGVPGLNLDVSLTVVRPWLRAASRNSWSRDIGVLGSQEVEGSVLWAPRQRRLAFGAGRQLGRGGLAGIVFLDRNANGRHDPGEPGLPDVVLRVGPEVVRTDTLGFFAVWDLVPFEPTVIEVDTLALPNPLWVPAAAVSRAGAAPNSFPLVEIALQEGAEVSGTVVIDDRPVGGARVIFRHTATGQTRDATTFSDGTFYLLGLRAGTYDVLPAPGLLEQLRARAEPLSIDVGGAFRQRLQGLVVRLVRD